MLAADNFYYYFLSFCVLVGFLYRNYLNLVVLEKIIGFLMKKIISVLVFRVVGDPVSGKSDEFKYTNQGIRD